MTDNNSTSTPSTSTPSTSTPTTPIPRWFPYEREMIPNVMISSCFEFENYDYVVVPTAYKDTPYRDNIYLVMKVICDSTCDSTCDVLYSPYNIIMGGSSGFIINKTAYLYTTGGGVSNYTYVFRLKKKYKFSFIKKLYSLL